MEQLNPLAILGAATLALASIFAANAAAAENASEPEPLPWPAAPQPAIESRLLQDAYADGVSQYLEVALPNSHLRIYDAVGWYIASARHSRFALQLNHRNHHSVEMGFSLFEPDAFLPDLGEDAWQGYLASLESRMPAVEVVASGEGASYGGGPFLFGKPYRYVEYLEPRHGEEPVRIVEFFLFADGQLMAITLRGQADTLERIRRQAYRVLTRMNLEKTRG